MKKLLMLMVAALVALALVGCGTNNDKDKNNANDNNAVEDGVNNENNTNGNVDNGVDHNGEARMDLAEDAADKVAELDEVDSATVIITDNNAYVAVIMNNNDDTSADDKQDDSTTTEEELSKDLEEKIAEKVREVKSDLNNVYVSLNPDFVERMSDYGKRINEGEPIEGFFGEFEQSIRNVFPDAN